MYLQCICVSSSPQSKPLSSHQDCRVSAWSTHICSCSFIIQSPACSHRRSGSATLSLRAFTGSTYPCRRNSESPAISYTVPGDLTLPGFQILSPLTSLLTSIITFLFLKPVTVHRTLERVIPSPRMLLPWLLTAWLLTLLYTSPYLSPPFCVGWKFLIAFPFTSHWPELCCAVTSQGAGNLSISFSSFDKAGERQAGMRGGESGL